ncbi:MAG: hypothetical protein WDM91_02360 [Rhizomicrobium sp.]
MTEVPLWRLYALRATYLIILVGMGVQVWPSIWHHDHPWELMQGVVKCMLAAVTVMAALGLRYPLKMLPLLFFEMVWKGLWLGVVALPLWRAGTLDADTMETVVACAMGVIFPVVIPWRYAAATYLREPGNRWVVRGAARGVVAAA